MIGKSCTDEADVKNISIDYGTLKQAMCTYDKYKGVIKVLLKLYGSCTRCGWCCRNERLTISVEENDVIKRRLHVTDNDDAIYKKHSVIVSFKLPCPYVNDVNRCNIYNVRPHVCREYPILFRYVDAITIARCPLGNKIIDDMLVFCEQHGIKVESSEESELGDENIAIDKLYDVLDLRRHDGFSPIVIHVPLPVFDTFLSTLYRHK